MIKSLRFLGYSLLLMLPFVSIAQDDAFQVIPQPNKMVKTEGNFAHKNKLSLRINKETLNPLLEYASEALQDNFEGNITLAKSKSSANLHFILDNKKPSSCQFILIKFSNQLIIF